MTVWHCVWRSVQLASSEGMKESSTMGVTPAARMPSYSTSSPVQL